MKTPSPILLAILLAACSRHYHPLDAGKKAPLVAETVSNSQICSAYKKRFQSPALDDDSIDDLYHAAMKAHCLNRDI